jgi:hypothetical protein
MVEAVTSYQVSPGFARSAHGAAARPSPTGVCRNGPPCWLSHLFLKDDTGRRPVNGGIECFHAELHWRDLVLFYEYFHGDTGQGLGASHQTGWTGLVARL